MSELKPCPFCGGESEMKLSGEEIDGQLFPLAIVQCVGLCGANAWQGDEESAIAAWDTRTESSEIAAMRAVVEAAEKVLSTHCKLLKAVFMEGQDEWKDEQRAKVKAIDDLTTALDELARVKEKQE